MTDTRDTPDPTDGYTDGWNAKSDSEALRMASLFVSTNDIAVAIEVLTGRVDAKRCGHR